MTRRIAWTAARLTRSALTHLVRRATGTDWELYVAHAGVDVEGLKR